MPLRNHVTVEIPLFFTFLSFLITEAIFTNLVMYRTCYIILGYNKTECAQLGTDDTNVTKSLEKLVQPKGDLILMIKTVIDALIPIFICAIAGPWSDKYGRKPVLLMTLIGMLSGSTIMAVFSYFEQLSPWYFLLSSIPGMLTGGGTTYFTVTLSYLSDISTMETRSIRMAIYEATISCGIFIGSVSSSYIFYATNYQTIFQLGNGFMLISVVYMLFFVPESLQNKQLYSKNSSNSTLETEDRRKIHLKYFADIIYTIKNRNNHDRKIILLIITGIIIFNFATNGEYGLQFIFLREKLNWTLTKFTIFNSITFVLSVIATMSGTFFFQKKLKIKESNIVLVCLAAMLGGSVLQLLATSDIFIYTSGVLKSCVGLISAMLRSQMSKMVPTDEIGKIFAVTVGGGALIALGAAPLYTLVYNVTININAALFTFLSIGLLAILTILMVSVSILGNNSYGTLRNEDETISED